MSFSLASINANWGQFVNQLPQNTKKNVQKSFLTSYCVQVAKTSLLAATSNIPVQVYARILWINCYSASLGGAIASLTHAVTTPLFQKIATNNNITWYATMLQNTISIGTATLALSVIGYSGASIYFAQSIIMTTGIMCLRTGFNSTSLTNNACYLGPMRVE